MYRSLADWLNWLPGGLLHTNIGASALFSAVSGSSVATAATISTIAIPTFKTRRYDPRLVLGSIAAGATLGNLIPPCIDIIVYGAMTNTSVGRLYAAGRDPRPAPDRALHADHRRRLLVEAGVRAARTRRRRRSPTSSRRLVDLIGPLVVFVVVMGSIYPAGRRATESPRSA